jgi:hypothetical protein
VAVDGGHRDLGSDHLDHRHIPQVLDRITGISARDDV